MTFGDVIDREKKESYEAGVEQGIEQGIEQAIKNMLANGRSAEEIAVFTGYDLDMVMLVKNGQKTEA